MKPTLGAPGTKRLKLTSDEMLVSFAFKFNLRCYTEVVSTPRAAVATPPAEPLAAIAVRTLSRLLRPEHGETLQSAAMLMQRLAPALLGIVGEGARRKNVGSTAAAARGYAVVGQRRLTLSNPRFLS